MTFAAIALALGGAAVIGLVVWFGAAAIGAEVLQAGWAIPAIMLLHGVQQYLSAISWRWAIGGTQPGLGRYFVVRVIREAVNGLLPVAQLGGNVVGIRLLMQRGVTGTAATAGTTVDVTIEAISQLLFTLVGVAVLAEISTDRSWAPWVEGGLIATGLGVAGFIVVQRFAGLRLVEWMAGPLTRVFPRLSLDTVRRLFEGLRERQRQPGMLLRATAVHVLATMLGVFETWLTLLAMGRPTSFAEAVVIESIGMAVRSAGFAVPGALGVQEAGFILVGGLLGVPPDQSIALSMVKRLRELGFGVPALVAWQWGEGRRLLGRRS